MIKAEWTNADALDLQPTCNQLATDCISRQAAIDALREEVEWEYDEKDEQWYYIEADMAIGAIERLPSAQPETAKRIVGKSRDGLILWYQCDMCNEPVGAQDNFCCGCGRRLTDG